MMPFTSRQIGNVRLSFKIGPKLDVRGGNNWYIICQQNDTCVADLDIYFKTQRDLLASRLRLSSVALHASLRVLTSTGMRR